MPTDGSASEKRPILSGCGRTGAASNPSGKRKDQRHRRGLDHARRHPDHRRGRTRRRQQPDSPDGVQPKAEGEPAESHHLRDLARHSFRQRNKSGSVSTRRSASRSRRCC